MMYGVMTLYEVSLLYYQKTTNGAVNRNLPSAIKVNESVYIASRTNQFCRQYAIILDEKRNQAS